MTWSTPLRGTAATIGTGGGNITPAEPAGAQLNDNLVVRITFRGNVPFTAPAGWSERLQRLGTGATAGVGIQVFDRKRGASAPDYTFTRSGGTSATAIVYAYRCTSGDFEFVDEAVGGTTTSTSTHSITGLTTVGDPCLLVGAVVFASTGVTLASWNATNPGTASTSTTDTTTAPSNGTWLTREVVTNGTGSSHRSYYVDALRETAGATGDIVATSSANTTASLGVVAYREISGGGGGGDTITATEITANTLFEGAAGSANVTISGTHTGATSNIQARILNMSSATVVDWTTIQSSVAAGAFSGALSVPRGGWYIAEVRKSSDTGVTDAQANRWGVGVFVGLIGQSHLRDHLADGTGTANDRALVHNGTAFALMGTTGAGQCAMANALIAELDCPVCIIGTGVGGTAVSYWWSSGKTAAYNTWESKVTAAGGDLSAWVWWQGDANIGDTKAAYIAAVSPMFTQVRTDYGASLPIIVGELGRKGGGAPDSSWEAIRDAHVDLGNDANNRSFVTLDAEQQGDQQHFTVAGHATLGPRIAQAILHGLGEVAYSRGPTISGATWFGAEVTVTFTPGGGADISPSSGITGLQVLDNATPATVTAAVRLNGTQARLTCSAALTGPVTVRAGYGAYPDVTGWLRDDTALALPLQTTDADVAAVQAPSYAGTTAGMAVATSISGGAGTYTAPPPSYAGATAGMAVATSISGGAGAYTAPSAPSYVGTTAGLSVAIGIAGGAGAYTPPPSSTTWAASVPPRGRRISTATRAP